MFKKGDIVRRIDGTYEGEYFVVVKSNIPIIHDYTATGRPMYRKSKSHMFIKPVGDENFPGEITALVGEYESVMQGRKTIKPHSFI
jgi:hypothetical protein